MIMRRYVGSTSLPASSSTPRTLTTQAARISIGLPSTLEPENLLGTSVRQASRVRKVGLEPTRPKAQEPKSCVSADFTTPASARSV